jgi:sodium/pantothenate symporter
MMTEFAPLAAVAGSNSAIVTFAIYILGVMVLAALSNRLLQSKSFLSEYFLGSRSLGVWAFALTFAATSSSGGSFIGFPSLVYTHGWVMALWIGSYMIVPIVSMGLLAKRINQVGRRTGAITVPDVMRDRFESPTFGILATGFIIFFMTFNLIAQFKGGSVILNTLLSDVPLFNDAKAPIAAFVSNIPILSAAAKDPGYLMCLGVFAVAVIIYTTYGGFRAVVWTDVMQGFVMVGGVILMLPLTLYAVGGLNTATQEMAKMVPPDHVKLKIERANAESNSFELPKNQWLVKKTNDGNEQVFRIKERAAIPENQTVAIRSADEEKDKSLVPAIQIKLTKLQRKQIADDLDDAPDLQITVVESKPYEYGANRPGVYVTGPGPNASSNGGFLPLALAVSFFFMWTFSGAGQPSNMVRLMAFKEASTLRRAIFTVSIYYTLIYFPLVIIFCCARVLLPGWETESDRIMPEMAKLVTAAINMPWLAGLLVAAPFAAVMSTMDSFLLMISSAVVRDVYQRNINPAASPKTIKRLTYVTTLAVGLAAMLAAVNPPQFLQDIIVFTGSGLSTSFLAPVALSLYWPRFNKQGAICGMVGGFATHITLYTLGYFEYGKMESIKPFGFHPFIVGAIASLVIAIVAALVTPAPPTHIVRKFFYRENAK